MEHFTPFSSLLGGLLIGLSATLMLVVHGRVAGISGIVARALDPVSTMAERSWRLLFLLGLVAGAVPLLGLMPDRFLLGTDRSLLATALAGALVGVGTRMGSGCTSGHGVCGISRLSPRSLLATATFMFTGAATVYAYNQLSGVVQ